LGSAQDKLLAQAIKNEFKPEREREERAYYILILV
jgi:hypothetical protein